MVIDVDGSQQGASTGLLDGRTGNKYFRTATQPLEDIEIGDQVVFWNSALYDVLQTGGAWRLENATVVDLRTTAEGTLNLDQLWLAGFGMFDSVSNYRAEFKETIEALLEHARQTIQSKLPNQTLSVVKQPNGHRLIRWAPFTGLSAGKTVGPWWLLYPLEPIPDSPFLPVEETVDKAVLAIPGAIGVEDAGGGAFNIVTASIPKPGTTAVPIVKRIAMPPGTTPATTFTAYSAAHQSLNLNLTKNVLFPLVVPGLGVEATESALGAWPRYLQRRAGKQVNSTLLNLELVDDTVIPGIVSHAGEVRTTAPKPRIGN